LAPARIASLASQVVAVYCSDSSSDGCMSNSSAILVQHLPDRAGRAWSAAPRCDYPIEIN